MSLILILALPFAGSLCAALLPSNARNAEAWLAGLIALACAVLVASLYPQVAGGGVVRLTSLGAGAGAAIHVAHGRLRLAVLADRLGHGCAGGAVRALLHVAGRPGAALLLLLPGLHGRHAGRGAVRQPDPTGDVLGNDQPGLVHADRLLAPSPGRAARRAHGAHRHRRGRAVPAGRRADPGPHRRQLRHGPGAGRWRPGARGSLVSRGAGAGGAGRADQERAVPVPVLATQRHGRAPRCRPTCTRPPW